MARAVFGWGFSGRGSCEVGAFGDGGFIRVVDMGRVGKRTASRDFGPAVFSLINIFQTC